jgi:Protein of unknown function (DUF2970)
MTAGPPPPAAAEALPPGTSAPVTPVEVTPVEVTPSHRPASFGRTAMAVFWSFFGVRKRRDHDSDAASLNPVHLIVAGVIGAALFVTLLLVLVNLVTRHK